MPDFSHEQIREMLMGALRPSGDEDVWVRDVYEGRAIIEDKGNLFQLAYSFDGEGNISLGERQRVKVSYEPFAELIGVEVLRAGTHTAENGTALTVTDEDLDAMVKAHEKLEGVLIPPLVVSHAEGDKGTEITVATVGAPTVGWMKRLYKEGKSLFMDFGDVPEKAVELVGTTLRRVSPEIYRNFEHNGEAYGRAFRRVSFVPVPSIKDLAAVTPEHLAYGEPPEQPTTWVTLHEKSPESTGKEKGKMDPLAKMQEQLDKLSEQIAMLTTEKTGLQEKVKKLEEEKATAVTKLTEQEKKARADEVHRFCDDLKEKGRLLPAWQDLGLEKFMEQLPDGEAAVVKFSEKGEGMTPLGFMKKFLEAIPETVKFGEVAPGKGPEVEDEKETAIAKYQELHKCDYGTAVKEVAKSRPELFKD